jgi:hypothetical protein
MTMSYAGAVPIQRKDAHVMGKYIVVEGAGLGNVSVYGPFDTPEVARMYAQVNNINGYVDILLHPYN